MAANCKQSEEMSTGDAMRLWGMGYVKQPSPKNPDP